MSTLTPDIILVFSIIFFTIILFISEVVRVDLVAFLVLALLGLTKLVSSPDLFSGFSSEAVIALISVMIIGAGLEKSGIMHTATHWILKLGGQNEKRISFLLMASTGILAGFLRSVGAVALFLPVVSRIRRRMGIAKSNILLPIGFCAILGSTLTMVGTGPLILLNSQLSSMAVLMPSQSKHFAPFGFFAVFPIGMALLAVGIVYFLFLGKFILPKEEKKSVSVGPTLDYFQKTYGIGGGIFEFTIPDDPFLANKTLKEWEQILGNQVAVIAIKTGQTILFPPMRNQEMKAGSEVAILGQKQDLETFSHFHHVKLSSHLKVFSELLNPAQSGLCEVVIPPSSQLVGQSLGELHLRRQFGLQVLALLRGNKVLLGEELKGVILRPGDLLGIYTSWFALSAFEKNPDYLVVTSDFPREDKKNEKAPLALFFLLLSLQLIVFADISLAIGLLVGAVGMIFSGVISMDEAYQSVSWRTVFLLAGLIPLGVAMNTTGADIWLVQELLYDFVNVPVIWLEIGVAVIAALLSLVVSNVGATIILVPLVVRLAIEVGADPRAFALLVAISASNAFLFPTHQANALIIGPGKYRVRDFMRAGIGMTILYIAVTILFLHKFI
jgi:di/tricarboxylate transporter